MAPDAKEQIDALCRSWAEDTGEPFVTLVARHGVIGHSRGFRPGTPAASRSNRDYRCWVASITKNGHHAILFRAISRPGINRPGRFADDRLSRLPRKTTCTCPHSGQCFNHTSGLSGHGELGDIAHAAPGEHRAQRDRCETSPGVKYAYCGLGYELVAKAMEIRRRSERRQTLP